MIKVYNGDAYAVQEEEYDRNRSLQFFLGGHKDEYILIYRGDRPIKVLSYYDVLYNREVPEKVLYLNPDIFAEARELFFSFKNPEDRWNRAVSDRIDIRLQFPIQPEIFFIDCSHMSGIMILLHHIRIKQYHKARSRPFAQM